MTTTSEAVWEPFAPGYTDDPYPQIAALRDADTPPEHPIGLYVLWRYDDVSALLAAGMSVEDRSLAPDSPMRGLIPSDPDSTPRGGASMLDRDPPDHTRLRRLVQRAFTPRAVAELEPLIGSLVDEALDGLADSAAPDLVSELAFPLPFAVITRMLGMPDGDTERIRDLSGLLVRSLEPVPDESVAEAIVAADEEMIQLVSDAIAWKRRNPADDLLTALIAARSDGDALTAEELVAQVILLYVAGHETTVNLISGGTKALLDHPDQYRRLREDPSLVPNAVEEMLRYDSPVQMTRRITTEPWSVRGRQIPAGTFVIGYLASANRDPLHFGPDADRLVVDRPTARDHLSFSTGVHHCLGSALARLEARVAFERLTQRFPELALAGPVEWNGRINLRGPATLPVQVR